MTTIETLLKELEEEAVTTNKMLACVPKTTNTTGSRTQRV